MSAWSPRQLIAFLARVEPLLDSMSHYELLDIAEGTDSKGVREAFHRMASQLHPDLYRLHITAEDHERLIRVYARVAEAYLVLRDPETREQYMAANTDRALGADGKSDETDEHSSPGARAALDSALPPRARRAYRRALALLQTGNYASAVLELRMAMASAPHSMLLREALDDALRRNNKPDS